MLASRDCLRASRSSCCRLCSHSLRPLRCKPTVATASIAATAAAATAASSPAQLLDGKAKPPGSLGALESWAIQLCEIQGTHQPSLDSAWLLLFAADHGITKSEPRVSAYPREVTRAMFGAVARGQAASSVLCAANGLQLLLADVGVDGDVQQCSDAAAPGIHVHHKKVAAGTAPFTSGPAMTHEQCSAAMAAGADAVARACAQSKHTTGTAAAEPNSRGRPAAPGAGVVVCVGELGLGNTTAASALLAALTGAPAEATTGRGTGVDNQGLTVKQQVVSAALQHNQQLIQQGPKAALAAVGGLELAAMVGAYIEAGRRGIPAVIDGFISGTAALAAVKMEPATKRCLFASHASAEKGAQLLLQELGLQPMLQLGLRLGEGTGAVLAVPLLRSAAAVVTNMASLQEVMASEAAAAAESGAAEDS